MKRSGNLVVLVCLFACGCTMVKTPSGLYVNVGFEKRFSDMSLTTTDGTRFNLKGYTSEGAAMAGAVAEGVARGVAP